MTGYAKVPLHYIAKNHVVYIMCKHNLFHWCLFCHLGLTVWHDHPWQSQTCYCAKHHSWVKVTIANYHLWTSAAANLKSLAWVVTEMFAKMHPDVTIPEHTVKHCTFIPSGFLCRKVKITYYNISSWATILARISDNTIIWLLFFSLLDGQIFCCDKWCEIESIIVFFLGCSPSQTFWQMIVNLKTSLAQGETRGGQSEEHCLLHFQHQKWKWYATLRWMIIVSSTKAQSPWN